MSSNNAGKSYKVTDSQILQIDRVLSSLILTRENHMVISECMKALIVDEIIEPITEPKTPK